MLVLSMTLLASCGDDPNDEPNDDEVFGPPIDESPIELPDEFEGVQGPLVDYIPE